MAEARRFRPQVLGALLLLLGWIAFRTGAGYVETRIAERIETESRRLGLRVRYDTLRVGVFPPVRITGLTFEKPGVAQGRIERLSIRPGLFGSLGSRVVARAWIEGASVSLPADLEVRLLPSGWEIDPQGAVTLKSPVEGFSVRRTSGSTGQSVELKVSRLNAEKVGAVVLEGLASRDIGVVDGEARLEARGSSDLQANWRFTGLGAETNGRVTITPGSPDTTLDGRVVVENLSFSRLFSAMGLTRDRAEDLGSLAGTVSVNGRLHEPATLAVLQQFDFRAPEPRPAAISRLRGEFTHDVITNTGASKSIRVSPASGDYVSLSEVPPLFIRTLLIAEDSAFYSHPGLDLTEVPRAIATNLARGGASRGASTITQQLAKNLFLTREKSLHRKLQELAYAFLLESGLGKHRILEIYLNIIEWGPGLYGLRPAARHYFDKAPQELTPREIAFLVAMIPGPVKYQRSIAGGEVRRGFESLVNNLLVKLRSVDALTDEEFQAALSQILVFRGHEPPADPGEARASH